MTDQNSASNVLRVATYYDVNELVSNIDRSSSDGGDEDYTTKDGLVDTSRRNRRYILTKLAALVGDDNSGSSTIHDRLKKS